MKRAGWRFWDENHERRPISTRSLHAVELLPVGARSGPFRGRWVALRRVPTTSRGTRRRWQSRARRLRAGLRRSSTPSAPATTRSPRKRRLATAGGWRLGENSERTARLQVQLAPSQMGPRASREAIRPSHGGSRSRSSRSRTSRYPSRSSGPWPVRPRQSASAARGSSTPSEDYLNATSQISQRCDGGCDAAAGDLSPRRQPLGGRPNRTLGPSRAGGEPSEGRLGGPASKLDRPPRSPRLRLWPAHPSLIQRTSRLGRRPRQKAPHDDGLGGRERRLVLLRPDLRPVLYGFKPGGGRLGRGGEGWYGDNAQHQPAVTEACADLE